MSTPGPMPVDTTKLVQLLQGYHDKEMADLLAQGFMEGFVIPSRGQSLGLRSKNLKPIEEHLQVAKDKVAKEVELGRVSGRYAKPP